MLRLCRESSCSYPGRSALHAECRGNQETRRPWKTDTLLLVSMEFSAFGGNIEGDDAEVSRGRENLIYEIEGLSAVWTGRYL